MSVSTQMPPHAGALDPRAADRPRPLAHVATPPGEQHKVWILAVLLAGQFMANVDVAVVNVATPSIRAGLHAPGGALQLVISGYVLAYAMLLITGARLGAARGYRRSFLAGLAGFTLASLACGLAPSASALILARVAQGGAAALLVPQVLSGIQLHFAGTERARAICWYALALSGCAVAGQVFGGALISADLFGSGWRPIFLVNVPLGAGLLALGRRVLPADRGHRPERLDLWGVATLAAAVLLAVLPLILGRDKGDPAWAWASRSASLPAGALFLAVERRVAARGGAPLVHLAVLARPAVAWGLGAYAAATSTYFSMLFILALYLQQGLGKSPLYSGLALVSWVAAFGVAGFLVRRLPARLAPLLPALGYLILAAGHLGISAGLVAGALGGALLMALLGVGGLGLGIGFGALLPHLTGSVPDRYAADLSGLLATILQIVAVLGIATFGTAYLSLAPQGGRQPATHAFAVVTAAFGVTVLLAAAAAYRSTHCPLPAGEAA